MQVGIAVSFSWVVLLLCTSIRLGAAEPNAKTVGAFDQYVQKAELRMNGELKSDRSFLWVDNLPKADRAAAYARLRDGEILVRPFAAGTHIPGGMIHDWVGAAFIPNATLDQTLAQIQDYDEYATIYSPEVTRSKMLERDGDNFQVSLWFRKKSPVTVVLDVVEDVEYVRLDPSREYSRAHSVRVIEVENPGTSLEREDPSYGGHGYLWKLDDYCSFLQTPEGVYLQIEAIALSRDIPWGLEWLIKPFVTKVPRESLVFTLARSRASFEPAPKFSAKLDTGGNKP
jgi:hypothetical protein